MLRSGHVVSKCFVGAGRSGCQPQFPTEDRSAPPEATSSLDVAGGRSNPSLMPFTHYGQGKEPSTDPYVYYGLHTCMYNPRMPGCHDASARPVQCCVADETASMHSLCIVESSGCHVHVIIHGIHDRDRPCNDILPSSV